MTDIIRPINVESPAGSIGSGAGFCLIVIKQATFNVQLDAPKAGDRSPAVGCRIAEELTVSERNGGSTI